MLFCPPQALSSTPSLCALEEALTALLSQYCSRDLLEVEKVTWQSPSDLIEKVGGQGQDEQRGRVSSGYGDVVPLDQHSRGGPPGATLEGHQEQAGPQHALLCPHTQGNSPGTPSCVALSSHARAIR